MNFTLLGLSEVGSPVLLGRNNLDIPPVVCEPPSGPFLCPSHKLDQVETSGERERKLKSFSRC